MTWVINKAGTDAKPYAVDPPYSKVNRYLANAAAVSAATPQYPGEHILALDTLDTYEATDMQTGHFQKQGVPAAGGGGGGGGPAVINPALLLHFDGANGSTSFPDSSGRGHVV